MAYENNTLSLQEKLMSFMSEQDPMQSMLQWLCEQLMDVEIAAKVNTLKKLFS